MAIGCRLPSHTPKLTAERLRRTPGACGQASDSISGQFAPIPHDTRPLCSGPSRGVLVPQRPDLRSPQLLDRLRLAEDEVVEHDYVLGPTAAAVVRGGIDGRVAERDADPGDD